MRKCNARPTICARALFVRNLGAGFPLCLCGHRPIKHTGRPKRRRAGSDAGAETSTKAPAMEAPTQALCRVPRQPHGRHAPHSATML